MMKRKSPFAWINGQPYLVVNFTLPPDDLPSLPELPARLLEQHPPEDIMVFRSLSRSEKRLCTQSISAAWSESCAMDRDPRSSRKDFGCGVRDPASPFQVIRDWVS